MVTPPSSGWSTTWRFTNVNRGVIGPVRRRTFAAPPTLARLRRQGPIDKHQTRLSGGPFDRTGAGKRGDRFGERVGLVDHGERFGVLDDLEPRVR